MFSSDVVAFASAPQHVVLAAQPLGQLDAVPHLRGGKAEYVGIRVGRRAGHVARMAEQVRRAPQELHAGRRHLLLNPIADPREVGDVLADRVRLGHYVGVVEAEIRQPQAGEELESFVQLVFRVRLIHRAGVPGTAECAGAEHVGALGAERVPVADRHPQMVFHPLAKHHAVLVVIAIGERVLGASPSNRIGGMSAK